MRSFVSITTLALSAVFAAPALADANEDMFAAACLQEAQAGIADGPICTMYNTIRQENAANKIPEPLREIFESGAELFEKAIELELESAGDEYPDWNSPENLERCDTDDIIVGTLRWMECLTDEGEE